MASSSSFIFLLCLIWFAHFPNNTHQGFVRADDAPENEKWLVRTMTSRRVLNSPDEIDTCIGEDCNPCPDPVGDESPCFCSSDKGYFLEAPHCLPLDEFSSDEED